MVGTATAKGGWTELNALDTSLGANAPSLTQCFIASNDTSPNETFTGTGANAYGFAVEIQAGVSSVIDAFTCTIKNSVMLMGCGI